MWTPIIATAACIVLLLAGCNSDGPAASRLRVTEENGVLTIIDLKTDFVFTVLSDERASVGNRPAKLNAGVYLNLKKGDYAGLDLLLVDRDKAGSVFLTDKIGQDGIWDPITPTSGASEE